MSRLRRASEATAQYYMGCVAIALDYMHQLHYVYRDLKPENVLLDHGGFIRIVDMGFVKKLRPGERLTHNAAPPTMPHRRCSQGGASATDATSGR